MDNQPEDEVKKILAQLAPYIAAHQGRIEFVSYNHPFVNLKLEGACAGCPISHITLKLGIQKKLREKFPDVEVTAVV
ncbi:MAG: NifU family protein, partial [Candidatus Komeilibacteria bacterium]|nr:NifU family protein [Candidatus Komeilibacteria bacterium]